MKEAIQAVIRRPRLIVEQALAYLTLGVLGYLWLGLPVGRWWQVVLLLISALAWLAGAVWCVRRALLLLRRDAPRLPAFQIFSTGIVLAAIALGVGFVLTGWVPPFASLAAQLASFALRFGLSYLLLIGCWLTFAALISAGSPRSTQESTGARP